MYIIEWLGKKIGTRDNWTKWRTQTPVCFANRTKYFKLIIIIFKFLPVVCNYYKKHFTSIDNDMNDNGRDLNNNCNRLSTDGHKPQTQTPTIERRSYRWRATSRATSIGREAGWLIIVIRLSTPFERWLTPSIAPLFTTEVRLGSRPTFRPPQRSERSKIQWNSVSFPTALEFVHYFLLLNTIIFIYKWVEKKINVRHLLC